MVGVDRFRQLLAWGEGTSGCLGFGDNRKKMIPSPLLFFEGKRIIDVACGDSFTVVIAEIEGDPMQRLKHKFDDDHYEKTGEIKECEVAPIDITE